MERPRVIAHVDLDAFYASVEIRDHPELAGKPVVVGGSLRRGVVTAASYEARKYGVHSAMPMARAVRLCPDLVVVKMHMGRYVEASEQFFDVLRRYSPAVEGLSMDEAFLDLTGTEGLLGRPADAVRRLRAEVRDQTRLAASAGIAPVKLAAKIASDLAKPDGQIEVKAEALQAFLDPLPVGRIFGVGPKTEAALHRAGIRLIRDLREARPERLRTLGGEASALLALARGEDPRPVVGDREASSVGAEETFQRDLVDFEDIETHLLGQAERVAFRLRHAGLVARGVTLKYKLDDFKLVTRQTTLDPPTSDGTTLFRAVTALLHEHAPKRPIRLCGVSAHALGPPPPPTLFEDVAGRRDRLNAAVDSVRDRFGEAAITRARLLEHARDDDGVDYRDPRKR